MMTIGSESRQRFELPARIVGGVAAVVAAASVLLSWSYDPAALDDMSFWGAPSPLQFHYLALGALAAILYLLPIALRPRNGSWTNWVAWNTAARFASFTLLGFPVIAVIAIALEAGGLINVDPGAWLALGAGVVATLAGVLLPTSPEPAMHRIKTHPVIQILAIAAGMGALLFAAVFALGLQDAGAFLLYAGFAAGLVLTLLRLGVFGWLAVCAAANKRVLVLAAFFVAFAFPFTQNGSEANMSIATQVLIFGATALGLNIVVGLVGLLDLGYIAFLGAGAFTSAVLSGSAFATINWTPPFWLTVLISGTVASLLGLLIGSPTLRVSGDYLAIVTLAFGEIFRITMNNLDGSDGPNVTNGSDGIPGIPDLNFFGFDFGATHVIFGVTIGRFANYFWLMLLILALIIVVFTNLNRSRIGRGWVAIREDELAAEAMGVNTFALKLLAFATGAFLAGVAGAVKAHHDVSVTPDQYVFLESAFLLAAVVLGGMGTVMGVLIGATILKLLPEKLRFFSDYRLLLFGLLLVFMMRFRPEGIIADERRQLEFHATDEELAEEVEEELVTYHAHYNPDPKGQK
ncbi:branched-chain amino acid ABC transporter permease [Propionicicella superfundia]|uniref:branched-chain amino acid ABC transporter permease n=1 Tax=Propionicicella superfundia TaxID=348582 RepID=UPI00041258D3|nr:branched-chain amino acid ABC transporter permease [Propionicicella superfundia]